MLATDSGQLCCFDATGTALWQTPLATVRWPAARWPSAIIILLAAGRVVWRVDGKTGKELAKEMPGDAGHLPFLLGNRLLLGGADGSLHQLTPP